MKNLQLIPDMYRQQTFLWTRFATHLLEQNNRLRRIQVLLGQRDKKNKRHKGNMLPFKPNRFGII